MLDVIALLTAGALFSLSALYVSACGRLKGNRP